MSEARAELRWIGERWRSFWFAPMSPVNHAVCRVVFYGYLLWMSLSFQSAAWASVPDAFWLPTATFERLGLVAASPALARGLDVAWKISLGLACLGLATRASAATAFVLGFYLLGLPQNFGKTDHWSGLLVVVLGVVAFARSGDALSVDSQIRTRTGGRGGHAASGEYRWPLRMVWLAMAWVFFAAGVSKLRHGGIEWMSAENFRLILLSHHYQLDRNLPELGLSIAEIPWLCSGLAIATVLLEVGAPASLVGRRARLVLIRGLFDFQLLNAFLLGVHARLPFLACYAFWVPWEHLRAVVGSRAPRGSGPGSIHRGSPEVTGAYSLHTSREVLGAHEAITPWNVSPSPSTRVRVIGPA